MGKYKVDTDRTRVKKLAALAFIPVADVVPSFESVAIRFLHDKLPFLSYFEKNWIGAPVAGNRRLALNYSLHMWNVLDRSSTVITGSIKNVATRYMNYCTHILSTPYDLEVVGQSQEPASSNIEHNPEGREGLA